MMKAMEFKNEVAFIAQAIGLAQERFDFIVDAFHPAVVDPVFPPGEDAGFMNQQGLCHWHHLAHPGLGGPGTPLVEEGFHPGVGRLFPEQAKPLFQEIKPIKSRS
jgi:hypothetical protein